MSGEILIADQIRCVRREIVMREFVYPRRVSSAKMKQETADRELAAMRAVLATLEELERQPLTQSADRRAAGPQDAADGCALQRGSRPQEARSCGGRETMSKGMGKMSEGKTPVGRLAMRVEGGNWSAYYATP